MAATTQKIAIVSGAAGYVGSAICRRLELEGYDVAALYRSTLPMAGTPYQCDLRDPKAVEVTLESIEQEMGPLSLAVHAAGSIPKMRPLYQLTTEDVRQQFEADVYPAQTFLSSCARRLVTHKKGTLIGITTAGVVTTKNTKARGVYSPVKFAQQGILVALQEELVSRGVAVYSIAPGVLEGGLNKETPKAFLDMIRALIPNKTLMNADGIAEVVARLARGEGGNFTTLLAPESA
jgi:NAD(P)-dependent dehydrogenase (short-subunit alcohol dehydrogenase family)